MDRGWLSATILRHDNALPSPQTMTRQINLPRQCRSLAAGPCISARALWRGLCTILLAVLAAECLAADEIPWQHHDWGRFQPGAWSHVRITTESLDDDGNVESTTVTDKRTTLAAINKRSVRLKMEVTVQVADKRFDAPPQDILDGPFGELVGRRIEDRELGEATTNIEGRVISCRVRQYEITTAENKKVVKIFYSAKIAPYILRRESVTTDLEGKRTMYRTSDEVLAVDMPHKVLTEIMPTSLVRTVNHNGRSTTTTWAFTSTQIPGGLVSYMSKESDPQERVIRHSTLELIDYGLEPKEDDGGTRRSDDLRPPFRERRDRRDRRER